MRIKGCRAIPLLCLLSVVAVPSIVAVPSEESADQTNTSTTSDDTKIINQSIVTTSVLLPPYVQHPQSSSIPPSLLDRRFLGVQCQDTLRRNKCQRKVRRKPHKCRKSKFRRRKCPVTCSACEEVGSQAALIRCMPWIGSRGICPAVQRSNRAYDSFIQTW